MKDSKSLLLVLLSVGLVATWIYHLYDKSKYAGRTREIYVKDSTAVAEAIKDSLQKIYTVTVQQLGEEKMNADSLSSTLKGELGEKVREITKLRNDINDILRKTNLTHGDLANANRMIKDLQKKIADMQNENNSLADERGRLNTVLDQLNKDMTTMQQNMQKITQENKDLNKTLSEASIFVASEIRLAAMNLRGEDKEVETSSIKKADKFVVSFVVQNQINDFDGAELVIAIFDPAGKIMIGEGWNPGSFDTKTGLKKDYTRKIRFEYKKGEQKRLIFSVNTEKFLKGVYTLNVYHNGVMIGETSWMLS